MRHTERRWWGGGARTRGATAERGQALPLVALLAWAAAAMALIIAMVGGRAIDAARAQAGADAAALGEAAARGSGSVLARANGVQLNAVEHSGVIAFSAGPAHRGAIEHGGAVAVTVSSGHGQAVAAAAGGRAGWFGLDDRMQRALRRAELLLGEELVVVSGFRSRAEQERLWATRHANPYPVARPGTSLHELGLAVDVALHQVARLAVMGDATGLCQPLPLVDPVHFTLCRTTPTR